MENELSQKLLKGKDIVIIGLQPWYYEIGSNCKNIALQLSRHNRVLYVNAPINRKTFWSKEKTEGVQKHCKVIREKGDPVQMVGNRIWELYPTSIVESINWLPSTAAFRSVNYINNRRFAQDIRKAANRLGFRDIVLFNDNDIFNGYYLKELLQPSLYIYYSRDYLQGYDYWKKHCTTLEPELIAKADLAIANSTYLSDFCGKYNQQSYYMGQGCNIELFDSERELPTPQDMKGISGPVIGYVGAIIAARLDIAIIEGIARANPAWNVVLVGPEDEVFAASALHGMPNVHFLGRKAMAELPAYVNSFDVCINPQLVNDITIGNYPLKIDEYLAMGKPVVATRTATMRLFEDYTYQADRGEDYPALISRALEEHSSQKEKERIAFARAHTWENCMEALGGAVKSWEASRKKKGAQLAAAL